MKLDLIIQDKNYLGKSVRLDNVELKHAAIIIEYAFKSGYEVMMKNHEEQ